jgi:hypothetical protein
VREKIHSLNDANVCPMIYDYGALSREDSLTSS